MTRPILSLVGVVAVLVGTSGPVAAQTATVPVGDFWFCDSAFQGGVCTTTVSAGDEVAWDFSGTSAGHTTTECGASCDDPASTPRWDSGTVPGGGAPFTFTFDEPGTYLYRCNVHPNVMRGQIVVQAPEPTATSPATLEEGPTDVGDQPAATATPSVPQVGGLPSAGHGPQSTGTAWWLAGATTAAGLALLSALAWYALRGRRS
jgi:plastocyanin